MLGTRTPRSLWRGETRRSWLLESGDLTIWTLWSASRSVRRGCGGRESCCSPGRPPIVLDYSEGSRLGPRAIFE